VISFFFIPEGALHASVSSPASLLRPSLSLSEISSRHEIPSLLILNSRKKKDPSRGGVEGREEEDPSFFPSVLLPLSSASFLKNKEENRKIVEKR
jgi:hypothetical protein